jgi:hypothetical protein
MADEDFFRAGEDIEALREIKLDQPKPALERLGPPPFKKSGFPMMGFLATLYEHVSQHVGTDPESDQPQMNADERR